MTALAFPKVDPVALSEFRAHVRTEVQALPQAPANECLLDVDPAIRGSLPAGMVWFRFSCLAVVGGPCPAWRLSQCHRNCWRRPKRAGAN